MVVVRSYFGLMCYLYIFYNIFIAQSMHPLYRHTQEIELRTGRVIHVLKSKTEHGSGSPKIILIHGNPNSLVGMEDMLTELSDFAECVALDLPGFGMSAVGQVTPETVGLDSHAEDVASLIDFLGWTENVYLVGHSHGGAVSQTVAAMYPDKIKGIALLGTLGYPRQLSYKLLRLPAVGYWLKKFTTLFRYPMFQKLLRKSLVFGAKTIYAPQPIDEGTIEYQMQLLSIRPQISETMVKVSYNNPCGKLKERADKIKCPVLFVHGEKDKLVPMKYAQSIHKLIEASNGNTQFETIPNAGHMLIDFQVEECTKIIKQFISSQ